MGEIFERIAKNWETSSVAIVAFIALILPMFGIDITAANVSTIIIGIQSVVLLFAKD